MHGTKLGISEALRKLRKRLSSNDSMKQIPSGGHHNRVKSIDKTEGQAYGPSPSAY